jgi:hypothetical protein
VTTMRPMSFTPVRVPGGGLLYPSSPLIKDLLG